MFDILHLGFVITPIIARPLLSRKLYKIVGNTFFIYFNLLRLAECHSSVGYFASTCHWCNLLCVWCNCLSCLVRCQSLARYSTFLPIWKSTSCNEALVMFQHYQCNNAAWRSAVYLAWPITKRSRVRIPSLLLAAW